MRFILPKISLKIERWKWNEEYGIYVSNLGNCKDKHKNTLSFKIDPRGYLHVVTTRGPRYVHRMVMLTWKPLNIETKMTVDHLDHNKRNNALTNLEWVTPEENLARAQRDLSKTCIGAPETKKAKVEVKPKELNGEPGVMAFNTLDEAAHWLLTTPAMANNKGCIPNLEKIKKNILKAIANDKQYALYKWRIG